jgi:hypothetical protein
LSVNVSHVELSHVVQAGSVWRFRFHIHLPRAAKLIEVVDELPAHEGLKRQVDVAEVDPLLQYFLLIDVDKLLRHARYVRGGYHADFGSFASRFEELIQVLHQEFRFLSGAVFENKLKSTRGADSLNRRRRKRKHGSLRQSNELEVELCLDDLKLLFQLLTVSPGFEAHEEERGYSLCAQY